MTFHRTLTLEIGPKGAAGFRVRSASPNDLRVAFDVQRDKSRDPNAATISIWGLAPERRDELAASDRSYVTLSAGYLSEGESSIFQGVLLHAESVRADNTMRTDLTLGDEAAARMALKRIHRVFPAGTPAATILRELVKATGLELGNLSDASAEARFAGAATLPRPYIATGSAVSELSAFARVLGFDWTIQDGKVQFLGLSKGVLGSGPLISQETGLESEPTVGKDGTIQFTTRLVADLMPGRPFEVRSDRASGVYVATATHHKGDTHGTAWGLDVDGEEIAKSLKKGLVVNGA